MGPAMDYLKSFKELLKLESNYLSNLVSQEEDKYEALKQVDVENLMRINNEEEDILHRLASVERKRKELIHTLSKIFKFDQNLTLTELFNYICGDGDEAIKKDLMKLRTSIKQEIEKLQISLQENSHIIQANLEIIGLTLNFANRNAQKETYDYRNKKESKESIYLINQLA
jgi:flagellar biosynthesis/type III secretory pathway chaperone